jgi:hypothetical protein
MVMVRRGRSIGGCLGERGEKEREERDFCVRAPLLSLAETNKRKRQQRQTRRPQQVGEDALGLRKRESLYQSSCVRLFFFLFLFLLSPPPDLRDLAARPK